MPRQRVVFPWYCIQCHPGKHELALWHLKHQKFETFMPTQKVLKGKPGKEEQVDEPLFPGYLFVRMDVYRARWQNILSTVGVKQLFRRDTGYPQPMPLLVMDIVLAQGQTALQELQDGALARVLRGPMQGHAGTVAELLPGDRVKVLLTLLGRNFFQILPRKAVASV